MFLDLVKHSGDEDGQNGVFDHCENILESCFDWTHRIGVADDVNFEVRLYEFLLEFLELFVIASAGAVLDFEGIISAILG